MPFSQEKRGIDRRIHRMHNVLPPMGPTRHDTGMALIDGIAAAAEPEAVFDAHRGCNRLAFSANEDAAFRFVETWTRDLFREHGLGPEDFTIWEDAIGNLFITIYGKNREETVMSGSHVDSVPDGGKFDGVAGVVSALDFLSTVIAHRGTMDCNFTVAIFRSEESSLTALACLGSNIATGTIDKRTLNDASYKNGSAGKNGSTLCEHFSERYGGLLWTLVERQLEPGNRTIEDGCLHDRQRGGKMTIRLYEELHIEQSALLERTDNDVGIVTDIGGATREEVTVPRLPTTRIHTPGRYERLQIRFMGDAAHSGGTPPNETEDRDDQGAWYRSDALLGCAWFVRSFLREWRAAGCDERDVFILRCAPPKPMGYTTVPPLQELTIAVGKKDALEAERIVNDLLPELEKRKNVRAVSQRTPCDPDVPFTATTMEHAGIAMELMETVERIVREKDATPAGHGRVRYTATDFVLDPNDAIAPLRWKMDMRHTAAAEGLTMQREFHRALEAFLTPLGLSVNDVLKRMTPVNHVQLDLAIAETKMAIAGLLGIPAHLMSCMPGHDARSMGLNGEPTGLTLVRHPGESHSPLETMEEDRYVACRRVSHAMLADALKLDWHTIASLA